MTKFITVGKTVLIDDGKVELVVEKIEGKRVHCKVKSGGAIKSHKGVNLPGTELKIDFLVDRDKSMLQGTLTYLKPEYIAVSFVKTRQDLLRFKEYVSELLEKDGIKDYYPKICTKIEMSEAISEENFDSVLNESDMIMIARGDLALETTPMHVSIPFIQEKIIQACRAKDKPFVVATQILESMMESAVPTRAEVSDLYRAVVLNKADYIMLSGESAAGKYPKKCIDIMNGLINFNQSQLQA